MGARSVPPAHGHQRRRRRRRHGLDRHGVADQPRDPRVHAGHRPPAARDVHAVRGGPRAVRHRGGVRVSGPRRRDAPRLHGGSEPDVPQRRPARRVLRDPQGRAVEAQARHARRVGGGPAPRAVEDAEEHREGRGRPRPRRHREAEPDGRLEARRGLGLRPHERGPLPRAVRSRLRVGRLRAVHPADPARGDPSAPGGGGGRRRPTRSAASTAPSVCSDRSRTASVPRRPSHGRPRRCRSDAVRLPGVPGARGTTCGRGRRDRGPRGQGRRTVRRRRRRGRQSSRRGQSRGSTRWRRWTIA